MTMNGLLVGDVMTRELLTLEQNEKLQRGEQMMRDRRVRHLLAVDEDGMLQGVLSQRDVFHGGLLKALGYGTHAREQALESLRIKDAMTSEPATTTATTPLRDAARSMAARKIGCLPVLEGDRLVGILTEGDFVILAAREPATGH